MNTNKHESVETVAEIKKLRKIMEKTHLGGKRNDEVRQQLNQEAIGSRNIKTKLVWIRNKKT